MQNVSSPVVLVAVTATNTSDLVVDFALDPRCHSLEVLDLSKDEKSKWRYGSSVCQDPSLPLGADPDRHVAVCLHTKIKSACTRLDKCC